MEADSRLAGAPVRFFQAALARALCLADESLAAAYWHPGPACGELPGLPAAGRYFFSLKFRSDVAETLGRLGNELANLDGFRVVGRSDRAFDPHPEGVILSFRNPGGWKDELIWGVQKYLNDKGIDYETRKLENGKIVRMTPAGRKLSGCRYLLWDFVSGTLRVALVPDGNYAGLFANAFGASLPLSESNAFRIETWFVKDDANKCPVCKAPGWLDAFDGETVKETPCTYLCGKRGS